MWFNKNHNYLYTKFYPNGAFENVFADNCNYYSCGSYFPKNAKKFMSKRHIGLMIQGNKHMCILNKTK